VLLWNPLFITMISSTDHNPHTIKSSSHVHSLKVQWLLPITRLLSVMDRISLLHYNQWCHLLCSGHFSKKIFPCISLHLY